METQTTAHSELFCPNCGCGNPQKTYDGYWCKWCKTEFYNSKVIYKPKEKQEAINLDHSLIDNIKFDGIDYRDYPDFTDAYIDSADYDGIPMTDDQLDEINEDRDFVYEKLMDHIY